MFLTFLICYEQKYPYFFYYVIIMFRNQIHLMFWSQDKGLLGGYTQ